ncbi:MAG: hypothetical protein EOM59_09980 [Clostridia bacterium]|nr:hypothetical protein [Clostridia bacterium]
MMLEHEDFYKDYISFKDNLVICNFCEYEKSNLNYDPCLNCFYFQDETKLFEFRAFNYKKKDGLKK